jgi:endonuclease/exonuclease/phosphatase family metal-dependent hydrolase
VAAVRVATYNVHRCIGTDRRRDPERVGEVLREIAADVVGLQEVDSLPDGAGSLGQLDVLGRAAGLQPVAGPILLHRRGQFGNAVLTRHPVRAIRRVDLTVPHHEPRGALDLDLEVAGRTVRVVVAHLGLFWADRVWQVHRLLTILGDDRDRTTILLGDFNEWRPRARPVRDLDRRLGRIPALATFPSRRPLLALDRIWAQPRTHLGAFAVHRTALARVASDHLPLRATVTLETG